MNLDNEDIDRLESLLAQHIEAEKQQESTNHGRRRVARFLVMTGVVIVIGFTGHVFHVEVIAKFGELVISCFYTFLMDEAQAGKGSDMLTKLGATIKARRSKNG